MEAPEASCCSISLEPQLGHNSREDFVGGGATASSAVFAAKETVRDMRFGMLVFAPVVLVMRNEVRDVAN